MWLESLAEDSLGSLAEAPGGTAASQGFSFGQMFGQQTPGSAGAPAISGAPVLSDHEGVWLETRHRLGQGEGGREGWGHGAVAVARGSGGG
jgi:hypothetical protein